MAPETWKRIIRERKKEVAIKIPAYVLRKGRGAYPNGPHDVPDEVFTAEYWEDKIAKEEKH